MDNNKIYPFARSGLGVRPRTRATSIGRIGRPGPGRPGLSRLRPLLADLGMTDAVAVAAALAPRPLVVSQAVNRAASY
jgi:hypothetical protein